MAQKKYKMRDLIVDGQPVTAITLPDVPRSLDDPVMARAYRNASKQMRWGNIYKRWRNHTQKVVSWGKHMQVDCDVSMLIINLRPDNKAMVGNGLATLFNLLTDTAFVKADQIRELYLKHVYAPDISEPLLLVLFSPHTAHMVDALSRDESIAAIMEGLNSTQ